MTRKTDDYLPAVETLCKQTGLPYPTPEYRFDRVNKRRWMFDFAWPNYHVALEVEGGIYVEGRHTRGAGYEADCEKYNAAVMQGWRVMRYTPRQLRDGNWTRDIQTLLEMEG